MREKYIKLANEYVVSLFPVFMIAIGIKRGTKKMLRYPVDITFKIENNAAEYYYLPKNWRAGHSLLVKKIRQDPNFLKLIYKKMVVLANRQIKYGQGIKTKIYKASNNQLFQYYQQFVQYNIELYQYGMVLPLLDFDKTTFLSDELHAILQKRKADKYFNILTVPQRQTATKKQELELLEVLGIIKKHAKCQKLFKMKETGQLIVEIKKQFPKIWQKIQAHTKKYCWAYFVYEGPATDEKYFIEFLQDFIKKRINPAEELTKDNKYRQQTINQQRAVLKTLKLNYYERQIAELAKDGVFYKAYRRELQSHSYYLIESLLSEIGRRLQLSLKQVRMLLPNEIGVALKNGASFLTRIQDRQRLLFFNYSVSGKTVCLSGAKARQFMQKNVIAEKFDLKADSFVGTSAFPGKVKGKVKIINYPSEIVKMAQGDILVATTTNPNLMPAIRMAKAIVTEEGGLTCHAAIVARELRIPCVVGAKAVAHALKDGDLVEVDADKGIVKRLK